MEPTSHHGGPPHRRRSCHRVPPQPRILSRKRARARVLRALVRPSAKGSLCRAARPPETLGAGGRPTKECAPHAIERTCKNESEQGLLSLLPNRPMEILEADTCQPGRLLMLYLRSVHYMYIMLHYKSSIMLHYIIVYSCLLIIL